MDAWGKCVYTSYLRERLPALMRDVDGLVALQMRYLVEDALVR